MGMYAYMYKIWGFWIKPVDRRTVHRWQWHQWQWCQRWHMMDNSWLYRLFGMIAKWTKYIPGCLFWGNRVFGKKKSFQEKVCTGVPPAWFRLWVHSLGLVITSDCYNVKKKSVENCLCKRVTLPNLQATDSHLSTMGCSLKTFHCIRYNYITTGQFTWYPQHS